MGLVTKVAWPRHSASLTTMAMLLVGSTPMWHPPIVLSPAVPPLEVVSNIIEGCMSYVDYKQSVVLYMRCKKGFLISVNKVTVQREYDDDYIPMES